MEQEVKRLVSLVIERYNGVTQDQMKGLISILYNTPQRQDIVKNNGLVTTIAKGDEAQTKRFFEAQIASLERHVGYSLNGLRKRREQELNLLFSAT